MPLSSYTIIHGDTKLFKKEITQWLTQLRDSI